MADDRIAELGALKALLWDSLVEAPVDKRGPLAEQYRKTMAELSALEIAAGGASDPVNEIAARRAARGGATARARRTAGGEG